MVSYIVSKACKKTDRLAEVDDEGSRTTDEACRIVRTVEY